MDPDELLVLTASLVVDLFLGARWYARLLRETSPQGAWAPRTRLLLGTWPLALLFFLVLALALGAAREVRESGLYILLFAALGGAWLFGISWGTELIGVSARYDAVERNNPAAAVAVAGAMTGGLFVYGFANLGEGDTIWTTIGPAALASMSCLALWAVHQALSGAADAIAIDRDVAAGARFAGLAIGTGLMVGRAVAGDYESAEGTLHDLIRLGWPAALLVGLAALVQHLLKPSKSMPQGKLLTTGILPAAGYALLGVVELMIRGAWWSGAAR